MGGERLPSARLVVNCWAATITRLMEGGYVRGVTKMSSVIVIGWMNGRYVMPDAGAYDLTSFSLAAMEKAVALDMAFGMDLMLEE